MNPFVNDQKREIDLPEGCKDLVEMLQVAKQDSNFKSKWKLARGLTEAERFLLTRLLAPAKLRHLSIELPKQAHRVHLAHIEGALSVVVAIDCGETGRLQAVRAVLHAAGAISTAGQVIGCVTTPLRLIICPLPSGGPDAAELIAQLLRNGFALPEETPLYFSYDEKDAA